MTPEADEQRPAETPGLEHEARSALPGGREPPGASWGDNFVMRVVAGVPALAAVVLLVALAPLRVLALVAAAAGVFGTWELTRLLAAGDGTRLPMGPMLFAALAIGLGGVIGGAATLNAGLLLGGVVVGWQLWFAAPTVGRDALRELGVALATLLLVPWLINHLGLLVQVPGGRGFVAFLIVAVTMSDTVAYVVGTFFGSWPLLPSVSPHKTVEGALGGVAGGAMAGVMARTWMGGDPVPFSLLGLITLGALLSMAAQAGDLLESKLKRLNHADDSGRFLPGHGGLLDRLDGYLLTAPLSFYILRYLAG
jgi:phosphatidate cytidylyltransferase